MQLQRSFSKVTMKFAVVFLTHCGQWLLSQRVDMAFTRTCPQCPDVSASILILRRCMSVVTLSVASVSVHDITCQQSRCWYVSSERLLTTYANFIVQFMQYQHVQLNSLLKSGWHWDLIISIHLGRLSTYPCFILCTVSKWDQTYDIHQSRLSTLAVST